MSHRIIISSRQAHEEPKPVEFEIDYTPPHDLTPEQVGDKVAKLLKLAEKMQE